MEILWNGRSVGRQGVEGRVELSPGQRTIFETLLRSGGKPVYRHALLGAVHNGCFPRCINWTESTVALACDMLRLKLATIGIALLEEVYLEHGGVTTYRLRAGGRATNFGNIDEGTGPGTKVPSLVAMLGETAAAAQVLGSKAAWERV